MPSSYNHPPQESLVQHFLTAHIDDLEERVNQLMAARHAHTQPFHTHSPNPSSSFCYHPSHRIDDYPFINHYVSETNKSVHEHTQTTSKLVSKETAVNKVKKRRSNVSPRQIQINQMTRK
jgi:hypothetical protein